MRRSYVRNSPDTLESADDFSHVTRGKHDIDTHLFSPKGEHGMRTQYSILIRQQCIIGYQVLVHALYKIKPDSSETGEDFDCSEQFVAWDRYMSTMYLRGSPPYW